jgi:single-stranded-DNA-specific exonuclease
MILIPLLKNLEKIIKYRWLIKDYYDEKTISESILSIRGIHSKQDKEFFLNPDYENHLHSPKLLKDIEKAINLTLEFIKEKKKILVFGDYDADGVTATALLYSFLKNVNANCDYFLPHRLKDGYGITPEGVHKAKEMNAELIITVDNGIVANDAIDEANKLNIPVIITDHHKQGETLPDAFAIINPNRLDCDYPFKAVSGVGVAFKFVQLLADELLEKSEQEKFLRWNLDLVALGTVADVMPILDENRTLVHFGLKVLAKTQRLGLAAILNLARKENDSTDTLLIGFRIAPKINAAGRLEAADIALKCLLTEDEKEAEKLALELENINKERQKITENAVEEAEKMIANKDKIIVLESKNWHQGILGLISARITEKHGKPSLISNIDTEKNILKSSGRSPKFFDITKAITHKPELLINGGGHVQACGCSVTQENFSEFKKSLIHYANENILDEQLTPELEIDMKLDKKQISFSTFHEIQKLSPFGHGFHEPIFLTEQLELTHFREVGFEGKHLQFTFKMNKQIIRGIGFGLGERSKKLNKNIKLDIVYTLSENIWNGNRNLQLIIKDFRA